jgi:regulatory protein
MDDQAALKKARSRALRFLTYRARTVKELETYLQQKEFAAGIVASVIAEMKDYGYLDDYKFSRDFINYRKSRGYGKKRIKYELKLKGIERDCVEELIADSFDREEELNVIRDMLRKRMPDDGIIDQRWVVRQAGFLARRGFQENLIMNILRELDNTDNSE